MNNNRNYTLLDYLSDNSLVIIFCFGFSMLLIGAGLRDYNEGDYFSSEGIWIADGILSGLWILAFTIDYFRQRKLLKK